MEDMNKEVFSATEKAKAKEGQVTEGEDELDQVWHLGRAHYTPTGAAPVFKECVAPAEHAGATFHKSKSEGEDRYLEDNAMTAVLRLLDDEFGSTGKYPTEESETSKTSAESSSSNQGEEKEQALDVTNSVRGTSATDPVQDILLGNLDCNEKDEVSPRVDRIESMLRDLEGDVWGERERIRSEVLVDSFDEDAAALTEIPVEQDSYCFLRTFFFPRKSALE